MFTYYYLQGYKQTMNFVDNIVEAGTLRALHMKAIAAITRSSFAAKGPSQHLFYHQAHSHIVEANYANYKQISLTIIP